MFFFLGEKKMNINGKDYSIEPMANLSGADLHGADLHRADLYGADLHGANLGGANLHGANLHGAYLYGADLHGADLGGANLYGANLHRANLYGADLHGADLYGADLHRADLYGADLHGADLGGANGILTFQPIGSRQDLLVCYMQKNILMFSVGCFSGNEKEFKLKIKKTHGKNQYATEYLEAIKMARIWSKRFEEK